MSGRMESERNRLPKMSSFNPSTPLSLRRPTRPVKVGSVTIGGGHPVVVQSMCATKTADVEATAAQVAQLQKAGAGVVRIAVDTQRDCEALAEVRRRTTANLAVDLQENYRLAAEVAPLVDKIRYNPGHLYHYERSRPYKTRSVFWSTWPAGTMCALRVGVNCGSVDPAKSISPLPQAGEGEMRPLILCRPCWKALEHCDLLDRLGFTRLLRVVETDRPSG